MFTYFDYLDNDYIGQNKLTFTNVDVGLLHRNREAEKNVLYVFKLMYTRV